MSASYLGMSGMTDKEWQAHLDRNHRFGHNANLGKIARSRGMLKSLGRDSLTNDQLIMADHIEKSLDILYDDIYTYRRDRDGTIAEIKHK